MTLKKFSVGSFNTRNLSLPNVEFYPGEKYTQAVYDKKVAWTSNQIIKMGCNIIGFQEVFQEQALKDCLKGTQLENGSFFIAPNVNGPCVAIASNFVLTDMEIISAIPDSVTTALGQYAITNTFSRPVIKANIEIDATTKIAVLVTHLKSKNPDFINTDETNDIYKYHLGVTRSLMKRAVEAAGIRALIIDIIKGNTNPLMLIGDLNDTQRAVTSDIISGQDSYKNMPLVNKQNLWDVKMYDACDILTQLTSSNIWYTYIFNGIYDIIDHIYFSQEFYFRNNIRQWEIDNVKILNDHLVDETDLNVYLDKTVSDHGQIAVQIQEHKAIN